MDRVFREYVYAYDLQDLAHALLDPEGLVENGHEQASAQGDPDPRLHRVLAKAVEGLDAKVLLDPLEEQLDPPPGLVDLRHDDRLDLKIVGEEDEILSRFRIQVADAAERVRIELPGLRAVEADGLWSARRPESLSVSVLLGRGDVRAAFG